jgi:hypothetical protein
MTQQSAICPSNSPPSTVQAELAPVDGSTTHNETGSARETDQRGQAVASQPGDKSLSGVAEVADRRRPNRVRYDNPELIALMRRAPPHQVPKDPEPQPDTDNYSRDQYESDLRPMQGIIIGTIIGAAMWVCIALVVAALI